MKYVWTLIIVLGWCFAISLVWHRMTKLVQAAPDQEYMLAFSTPENPLVVFGVAQPGINKSQAEAAEVQMNRVFQEHSIPVIVRARKLIDVGNFHPKEANK